MRATHIYGAGDIRVINAPDPVIRQPTDAVVRVVRACICGSDLHPYHNMAATAEGNSIGHECIGVVEETGGDVTSVSKGDLVIVPFAWSDGTHVVIEAVGHMPAYEQAIGAVRPGGVISRVGVPQYDKAPVGFASIFGPNITLTGGPAPARAYIQTLMPGILTGQVNPGRVFDRELTLDQIPQGYEEMDSGQALKVLIRP
jgi:threonine dehydrogenase-like Zn-dependent dehydrogenase